MVRFSVICKGAKRVDGGMDEDAGEQAAAAIKDCDQQEADCNRKDNLAQVVDQIHTAAVEQVDDMSDAKSHTGDNNGGFDIVLCNGLKQKPRKITSSKNPTQSIHTIRQTVSAGE